MKQKRNRFKQPDVLESRLAERARVLREQASNLQPGPQKDELIRRAAMVEEAAAMSAWLRPVTVLPSFGPPSLKPPSLDSVVNRAPQEPVPSGSVCAQPQTEDQMAVNKPTGDNARKGAVKKRSQTTTTIGGATGYTKRDRSSGEFMAVKKPAKPKKAAKKFKGVRVEKKTAKKASKK